MSMRLAIMACPYSGTNYIGKLLNLIGISIGHERVYGSDGIVSWRHALWKREDFKDPRRLFPHDELRKDMVDTLGAGFSDDLTILHQIRHPLMVISALCRMPEIDVEKATVYLGKAGMQWNALAERYPIRRAAKFWLTWNTRMEETADFSYTIETLPGIWEEFLSRLEVAWMPMPELGRTIGRKSWTKTVLSWKQVYNSAPGATDQIFEYAERFGYTREPLEYMGDAHYQFRGNQS